MPIGRRNNYQYAMTVGKDGTGLIYGYNETDGYGELQSIAKPLAGKPVAIFADSLGDCTLIPDADYATTLGDEIEISFEGFNTEIAGGTPTTNFGAPVRLQWDDANGYYSTVGLSGDRINLTTWLSNREGEVVYIKFTGYTKP